MRGMREARLWQGLVQPRILENTTSRRATIQVAALLLSYLRQSETGRSVDMLPTRHQCRVVASWSEMRRMRGTRIRKGLLRESLLRLSRAHGVSP